MNANFIWMNYQWMNECKKVLTSTQDRRAWCERCSKPERFLRLKHFPELERWKCQNFLPSHPRLRRSEVWPVETLSLMNCRTTFQWRQMRRRWRHQNYFCWIRRHRRRCLRFDSGFDSALKENVNRCFGFRNDFFIPTYAILYKICHYFWILYFTHVYDLFHLSGKQNNRFRITNTKWSKNWMISEWILTVTSFPKKHQSILFYLIQIPTVDFIERANFKCW